MTSASAARSPRRLAAVALAAAALVAAFGGVSAGAVGSQTGHARGGHATAGQMTKAERARARRADARHKHPSAPARARGWWRPAAASPLPLYWILSQPLSASDVLPAPAVFDIDGESNGAAIVSALHAVGARVICYVDAGTWEPGRSDSAAFPAALQGNGVQGWPGEKWLDIRQVDALGAIMRARFQRCKDKGFDAIEPDNIDGYSNSSGFPLSAADQIAYNTALAGWAHALGLSIGLKNDGEQAASLAPHFDWALDEQCYDYSECSYLTTFTSANKAAWIAEYRPLTPTECADSNANRFNSAQYDLNLGASGRQACA